MDIEKYIQCLSCGHSYPDPLYMEYDGSAEICYCCGHMYENIGGIEKRLSEHTVNHQLYSDLFAIINSKENIYSIIKVLSKYVPLINRACFDKRSSVEILATSIALGGGFPSETILYYGVPLGVTWCEKEECYYEYWLNTDGVLVKNKVTAPQLDTYKSLNQDGREAWYSELNVELKGEVSKDDNIVSELEETIRSNCNKYICRYASYKLNTSLLTTEERIKIIISFYFEQYVKDIFGLCWETLQQTILEYSQQKIEIGELVCAVKQRVSAGYISDIELEILSNLSEREIAVKILVQALKLNERGTFDNQGINREMKNKVRTMMHNMDAKLLIGWCPCDICTSKRRR